MNALTAIAGESMSPHSEAIIMMILGLGATVFGLIAVRHTDFLLSYSNQSQQDFHDAYGWPAPTADTRKFNRIIAKIVGWGLVAVGGTFVIIGIFNLVAR